MPSLHASASASDTASKPSRRVVVATSGIILAALAAVAVGGFGPKLQQATFRPRQFERLVHYGAIASTAMAGLGFLAPLWASIRAVAADVSTAFANSDRRPRPSAGCRASATMQRRARCALSALYTAATAAAAAMFFGASLPVFFEGLSLRINLPRFVYRLSSRLRRIDGVASCATLDSLRLQSPIELSSELKSRLGGCCCLLAVGQTLRCNHPSLPSQLTIRSLLAVGWSDGLFRSMTGMRGREELVIEAALDSAGPFLPIPFRYKPGALSRAPPWVAPHQPRLDWQVRTQPKSRVNYTRTKPQDLNTRQNTCTGQKGITSGLITCAAVCAVVRCGSRR